MLPGLRPPPVHPHLPPQAGQHPLLLCSAAPPAGPGRKLGGRVYLPFGRRAARHVKADNSVRNDAHQVSTGMVMLVDWLLNVPATCQCISQTDGWWCCWLLACLTSQQHVSVSHRQMGGGAVGYLPA